MLKKAGVLVFSFFISLGVFANSTDLKIEKTELEKEFSSVSSLELYLASHPDANLETIKAENPQLLENLNLDANVSTTVAPMKDMPLVGSFWWGCCLGVIGLALVYFITDKDKQEVKSAFWGCLIATIIWGVGGLWNPFGW